MARKLLVLGDRPSVIGEHAPAVDQMGPPERGENMLWTIAIILALLWLLGFITSYTLGGFIHVLLVVAVVVIVIRIIQGRRSN
jgi:hypothetical protein